MDNILKVLLFASISFATLFVISKLLGKKQIAELTFIDYVTGISIGSIAADMATDIETPFYLYIISMTVFFAFDFVITLFEQKTNVLKRFLRGTPIILINNGKVDYAALKKSKIDFYDLLGLARDKGYFDLAEIQFAIFETNGNLSILANDNYRQVKKEDFPSIPSSKSSLTYYVIVDGNISKFALKQINKDNSWVEKELKIQKINLQDVLFAVYNENNDNLQITKK